MKNFFKEKGVKIDASDLQDKAFLGVIFIFFAVLIIALVPGKDTEFVYGKKFFIYIMMLVPAIAAIYFIIISVRRNFYLEPFDFNSSIRSKLALAFLFVAVIPMLIIIIASSNFMNKTFSSLISGKTSKALNEAVTMSEEPLGDSRDIIMGELKSLKYYMKKGLLSPAVKSQRQKIREASKIRNISIAF